jgi:hypothetical protein
MCTTPSWWTARQGWLVVIPVASMRNLPTGTQETKNPFESHKAKRLEADIRGGALD